MSKSFRELAGGSPEDAGAVRARGALAGLLAAHRAESGLSQEALAAAAGMSVRAVRDLEAGRVRVPQQRSAIALVRVLSLTGEARESFLTAVAEARRDRARIRAGDDPTPDFAYPTPAQLPPAPGDFTGRTAETAALRRRLLDASAPDRQRTGAAVTAITGEGGLGKTALALHTAHMSRADFPDGQLYVDLRASRGASPNAAALPARLLRGLGVPDRAVPSGTEPRIALYRRVTEGRRLLVVLDDAPNVADVRPLLPAAATSAVLVTSRQGRDRDRDGAPTGAGELRLRPLSRPAAAELFARLAGPARVAGEPEAAAAMVELCAGSPLALRVMAARLAGRPRWSIAAMLRRLTGEWDRAAAWGRLPDLAQGPGGLQGRGGADHHRPAVTAASGPGVTPSERSVRA
ncbi:helix-turn-helix domain-containing protein [Streptomyces sp. B6B3]|uniref:helix-turn-helix domain-containing protein n=1 Tax=Streptomyces sp. B6B3 TaxID=3153570 RepID=UPI00325C753C